MLLTKIAIKNYKTGDGGDQKHHSTILGKPPYKLNVIHHMYNIFTIM